MGPSNDILDGVTTTDKAVQDQWNHLAITQISDGTLKIYLNGKLQRGQRTNQLSWKNPRMGDPSTPVNYWQNGQFTSLPDDAGLDQGALKLATTAMEETRIVAIWIESIFITL